MSAPFRSVLALSEAMVLVSAVAVLWLGPLRAVLRAASLQGVAVGMVALALGIHGRDATLIATAVVVVAVKAVAIPLMLRRMAGADLDAREARPVVSVPASLIAAASLSLVAFASTLGLAARVHGAGAPLVPIGFATVLVGVFVVVARAHPVFQMVGILLVDNGVASIGFLLTSGVPFLIEMGVSLDVLLGVVVIVALGTRIAQRSTSPEDDQGRRSLMRELRD